MTTEYACKLREHLESHELSMKDSAFWEGMDQWITDEVLEDALQKTLFYFHSTKVRPKKNIERVRQKMKSMTRFDKEFKVHCDFSAVRVHCLPRDIYSKAEELKKWVVEENRGQFVVRNDILDVDGKLDDIVLYAYAYIPLLGYVTEFQIGSAFSALTFAHDSLIRDGGETDDYWDNDFYDNVKRHILSGEAVDLSECGFEGKVTPELIVAIEKDGVIVKP